jgi:hypothetical protein
MEDTSGEVVIVSLENVACQGVPVFASLRESGKKCQSAS